LTSRILIQTHRRDSPIEGSKYTLNSLLGFWRQMGLSILFQSGLPPWGTVAAEIAMNHICATRTPAPYLNYLCRFPTVINGALVDTSKQLYNRDLLSRGNRYDGPVIIKTKLNSGGANEHKHAGELTRYLNALLRASARPFRRNTHWSTTARLKSRHYPVYDSPSLVPAEVWTNPNLLVQKFQPELEGDNLYRLRSWYLLGDRGFHVVTVGKEPIVKGVNIVDRRVANDGTPTELAEVRKTMRVDFGRFDYVMVGGKAVVYDINRTPKNSPEAVAKYATQWRGLAEGIAAFTRDRVGQARLAPETRFDRIAYPE
jgi:hypothetical protein